MAAERSDGRGSSGEKRSGEGRIHTPVLLDEVLQALSPRPGGVVLDATVGLGGHAEAVLSRLGPEGFLVGIDRDGDALERTRNRLEERGHRFHLFRGLFTQMGEALRAANRSPEAGVGGILLDLGVSSLQLDSPRRGFSFLRDGPLDMRMSPDAGVSAAKWIAGATLDEIESVLRNFGEEPAAARVARAIVAARERGSIETTHQLVRVIESVKVRRRGKIHPATKVFQAIRIEVNSELSLLETCLRDVDRYLAPAGRLVVISYHSLEDRLVKRTIRARVREGLFQRVRPELIRPREEEVRVNPRARSARLRWAVRSGSPAERK